jgi:predicted DNA-binding protein
MPSKKYQPTNIALLEADKLKLAKLASEQGKTKSEVARDAILWYLDNHESAETQVRDDRLARVIFKATDRIVAVMMNCTNRICSLQVRSIIDTNITMMMFYRVLPPDQADSIMAKMYRMAVSRVTRKIPPEELNIATMIKEGLEQEILEEVRQEKK